MAKAILTATEVRNNFFNLINLVVKTGEPIFVKRDREVVVKLEPVGTDLKDRAKEIKKWLDRTRGMWADSSEEDISGRFKEADKKATLRIRRRKW